MERLFFLNLANILLQIAMSFGPSECNIILGFHNIANSWPNFHKSANTNIKEIPKAADAGLENFSVFFTKLTLVGTAP
jgi:hypothetical protein